MMAALSCLSAQAASVEIEAAALLWPALRSRLAAVLGLQDGGAAAASGGGRRLAEVAAGASGAGTMGFVSLVRLPSEQLAEGSVAGLELRIVVRGGGGGDEPDGAESEELGGGGALAGSKDRTPRQVFAELYKRSRAGAGSEGALDLGLSGRQLVRARNQRDDATAACST